MGTNRARDSAKEAAWRRRLELHADSGQSVRAWCRRHHLKEAAFYWWRRELARRDAKQRRSARRDAGESAVSFVPVHVTEGSARDGDWPIEIVLTDGQRVRVTCPVNGQALADVLDVLERRAC